MIDITFRVVSRGDGYSTGLKNCVYLEIDRWNDYSFVTMFEVFAYDDNGTGRKLPNIKIGFYGQTTETSTYETLNNEFTELSINYFSVATDVEFYRTLSRDFSSEWRDAFLHKIRDVVYNPDILERAKDEEVFQTSHLRSVSVNAIQTQFSRVLAGEAPQTDFLFNFILPESEKFAGFNLHFEVNAGSLPGTNIHALIGRNGVGKTTLLKHMVRSIAGSAEAGTGFYHKPMWAMESEWLGRDFFTNLVSVAFSAFDPFDLPAANDNPSTGTPYSYIGLTDYSGEDGSILKSRDELHGEFIASLNFCFSEPLRKARWSESIGLLESDQNFAEMSLLSLLDLDPPEALEWAKVLISKMSSGHAITILTITQLIEKVEEKTLVLIDEPESHLHPPLLSAFVRSLSNLLHKQNAVAIVATHSPVVLQEVPKSCVWKLYRERASSEKARPTIETFGENVGTLTKEVFQLEVEKSGFHTLLENAVARGGTYEEIIDEFNSSLGLEARGILRALVINRDKFLQ
ncbi:AAA family ATPase [Sagittula sp. NFXS13]|uniref:AAA family ATPase n=1 Tax=Sagittula sp. NFXS13 TaxID=2819095 RepID=UPI0032E001BB